MGRGYPSTYLKKVGEALNLGTIVAAICGATEGLANMGYLDSRKHTSNDLNYLKRSVLIIKEKNFMRWDM